MKFGIRNGDFFTCGSHGTPAPLLFPVVAVSTVFFDKMPAFGFTGALTCGCPLLSTSKTVLISGNPAVRVNDSLAAGSFLQGSPTIIIGD